MYQVNTYFEPVYAIDKMPIGKLCQYDIIYYVAFFCQMASPSQKGLKAIVKKFLIHDIFAAYNEHQ